MATPSETTSLPTDVPAEDPQPQNTLMGLPTELRLDIIERVVLNAISHTFSRSDSGETLYQLWYHLFLGDNVYTLDSQTNLMTRWALWSSLSNISSPNELYTYRPCIPTILHATRALREESREVYLKVARKVMKDYEARHAELLPLFIDGYEAWRVRPYVGAGKAIGHSEGELRVEGAELAELCIRWYALKGICEVLENDGGAGGS